MAAELGADSLFYLPLEAVARCIGLPEDRLCRACLTGEYPTPTGERLYQLALRNRTRQRQRPHLRIGRVRGGLQDAVGLGTVGLRRLRLLDPPYAARRSDGSKSSSRLFRTESLNACERCWYVAIISP